MRSRHFHTTNGLRFSGSRTKTTLSEVSVQPVLGTPECDCCIHTGPNELYLCPEFVWFDLNDASVNTATDCVQINPNGLQQWAKCFMVHFHHTEKAGVEATLICL